MQSFPRLDHVTVSTVDFARSAGFYDAALGALGMTRLRELVDEEEDDAQVEAAAWGTDSTDHAADSDGANALVWLVSGATSTTDLHIRFRTQSRAEVETFYRVAVESGGTGQLAPRRWTPYRRGEFQAVVRDPDGNLIEAVSPE